MFDRLKLFLIHGAVHLVLYTIPRLVYALLVRLPSSIVEFAVHGRARSLDLKRERATIVVTSKTDAETAGRMRHLCGVADGATVDGVATMPYTDPMYSGHIHTIVGALRLPRRVPYERELLDGHDGNPICLDWLCVPQERAGEVKGVILVVPGAGNYGQTPYIQQLSREAVRRGYHICILTPRGMGSAPLKVPRLTCAAFTADVHTTLRQRFTLAEIQRTFGRDLPLITVGYSAGGSTLLKAIAEELGDSKSAAYYTGGFPVKACIAMNSPYDMEVHGATMMGRVARALYQKPMVTAFRKYTFKHWAVLKDGIPGLPPVSEAQMRARMKEFTTLRHFEQHLIAPHFGYDGVLGYYKDANAPQYARRISDEVAVVAVASRDDPIVGYGFTADMWQELVDEQPNVAYVETAVGGHLGYLQGPLDEYKGRASFLTSYPIDVADRRVAEIAVDAN